MDEPQFSNVIHDWEVFDSDKNFGENVLIRLIPADGDLVSNLIELWQDQFWLQTDPIRDDWQGLLQVGVVDVEGLLVGDTHVIDFVYVDGVLVFSSEGL